MKHAPLPWEKYARVSEAGPALLEALKNLLGAFRIVGTQKDYDTYSSELFDAEEAITKAEEYEGRGEVDEQIDERNRPDQK